MKFDKNVTIGCDPELFLFDIDRNEFCSAEGLLTKNGYGTKSNPLVVKDKYFTLQEDNVLLEYTIEPVTTKEAFINNNQFMLDYIDTVLPKHMEYRIVTTAKLDDVYINTKHAQLAGCEADVNMWKREENPKPELNNTNFRSAGGHIHIGFDNATIDECVDLIRKLDIVVGIWSLLKDPDVERRKLYGRAGSARFSNKYSGVEWRVPSNFWLNNPGEMYDNVIAALYADINTEDYLDVEEIINKHDVNAASEINKQLNICVESMAIAG